MSENQSKLLYKKRYIEILDMVRRFVYGLLSPTNVVDLVICGHSLRCGRRGTIGFGMSLHVMWMTSVAHNILDVGRC